MQIPDPSKLTGKSGSTLQKTSDSFSFPKIEAYNVTAAKESSTNAGGYVLAAVELGVYFVMVWVSPRTVMIPMFIFQSLNMLNYMSVDPPPLVYYFLATLEATHLSFLPNIFSPGIPASCRFTNTLQKVIDLNTDNMFIRNAGYIVFLGAFYLLAFLVIKLLTLEKVVKSRQVRQFCEDYLQRRFGLNILYEITLPLFYRLVYFSFVQFTQFTLPCPIGGLSIFLAIVSLLLALAVPSLLVYRLCQ